MGGVHRALKHQRQRADKPPGSDGHRKPPVRRQGRESPDQGAPASLGGTQHQRRNQQQGEKRHQNETAGFEGAAEPQRAESERGQIGAELGKNLGEDVYKRQV